MKLILTRHAKADPRRPDLADHDRPLSARGERDAAAMGRWLALRSHVPALVLTSTARRTIATWAGIESALAEGAHVQPEADLYTADVHRMLSLLRAASTERVLIIGHNPAIGEFATRMVTRPLEHSRFEDFPTGATLVAELDIEMWKNTRFAMARPVDFAVPRDID